MLPSNSTAKLLDMEHMQIKHVEQNESCISLYVEMERRLCRCPDCGLLTGQIHDYRTQRVKDSPVQGKCVIWVYRKRRYRCRRHIFDPLQGRRPGRAAKQQKAEGILRLRLSTKWQLSLDRQPKTWYRSDGSIEPPYYVMMS